MVWYVCMYLCVCIYACMCDVNAIRCIGILIHLIQICQIKILMLIFSWHDQTRVSDPSIKCSPVTPNIKYTTNKPST